MRNKRPIDRTKKSNIKCEHCRFYNRERSVCQREPKYNLSIEYWRRKSCFEWPDEETIDDGFGNAWSAYCPECGKKTVSVVRPGKVQCSNCG